MRGTNGILECKFLSENAHRASTRTQTLSPTHRLLVEGKTIETHALHLVPAVMQHEIYPRWCQQQNKIK
jgi:hypothetical protein